MKILALALLLFLPLFSQQSAAIANPAMEKFEYATPDDSISSVKTSVTRCMRRSMSKVGSIPIQISGDACNPDPTRTDRMARPQGELEDQGKPFKSRAF